MSEVIKRDQYGYKIYPLPDGSEVLWAEEDRVLFHRSSPESMPLTIDPDGVFEDLLALVDSLKHRIKVRESQLSYRKRMATIRDEKLTERDRTIARLTEEMKVLEKFPRETGGTGDHVLDFDYLHMIKLEIDYDDRDFSTLGTDDIEDVLLAVERVREEQRAKALGSE